MKAVYRKKIYKAGNTLEFEYTYPTRFGECMTRKRHTKATPEEMQAYNEELAIRKLTRIINENFKPDDWFITFHYEKEKRPPNYEEACEQLSKFMRKLRKLYGEWEIEFKYVKRTAYGERGGVHHHVVLPQGADMRKVSALWKTYVKSTMKVRPPDCRALYDTGEYSSLAAYIVKQKSPEDALYVKKWQGSRNLKKPVQKSCEDIHEIKWKEPPQAPAGYYIDEDSIRAGCNPITNKPYLFYRAVKLPSDFVCYDENGKRIHGSDAIKYFRKKNKDWLKNNWDENKWKLICPEGEIIFKNEKEVRQDE